MKNLYFSLLMLSLLNIDSLSQLDHAVNKTLHPRYRGIPSKIEDTGLESNMLNMNILEDTFLNSRSLKKGFKAIVTNLHLYRLMKGKNITSHIVRREIPLQWLLKFGS